ncbi:autotransporter domain-containing protein, partial [Bordetella sp. 15P40C-2]|uniref:autotransporter outer membrane beta-barrel domain-containing protein n=1 Tax=Bordetella sp. 15P40C-2 TaxID=2572246 RepID=UPI001323ED18
DLQGDGTMNRGAISTTGDVAYGLLAQSIGGGGGQGADGSANTAQSGNSTSSVTLGASGATPNGGSGGQITTGNGSSASVLSVNTAGFNSHGIVLQSIGGGGGTASVASLDISDGGATPNFTLTLGGGGGAYNSGIASPVSSSSGGPIGVEAWLNVHTSGEHAFGLVAQSIGGGGGIVASGAASNVAQVAIGGSPTGQGLAGDTLSITIGNFGSQANSPNPAVIATTGTGSHGIVLQSIGGGGGIAGYTANGVLTPQWNGTPLKEPRGGASTGGEVVLQYTGTLSTTGDGAFGIIAQSIADGGGLAGDSVGSYAGSAYDHTAAGAGGSTAGNVSIGQNGKLSVSGNNAYAIFAQSDGNISNNNTVSVLINGDVSATAPTGGGVWIDGTAQSNTVTLSSGASLSAPTAINNTALQPVVFTNHGSVQGNQYLNGRNGPGTLENHGQVLNADTIDGRVNNHGQFLVGQSQGAARTHITGDFNQTPNGLLQIGADFVDQTTDVLRVDGQATLGGTLNIQSSRLMPERPVVFLESTLINPASTPRGASPLFDYNTTYAPGHATVALGASHFDTLAREYGAGSNLRELGDHLQDIWARGSDERLAELYAGFDRAARQGASSFNDALANLAPGISAAPAALKQADMARFASSMQSCPQFQSADLRLSESPCVWGNIATRSTHVDGSHGTSSFDASGVTYQLGVQQQLASKWFVGVSAAYENGHIRADDGRQKLSGHTAYLGATLKHESGPWTIAGTLTGSYASYDSSRRISSTAHGDLSAKSSPDVFSLGQRLRVAYTHAMNQAYIKPMVDVDLIYTRMPSYSEQGAGALNLHYESADKWAAILTPGIEIGGRVDLNGKHVLRPYLHVGLSLTSTDHWDSYARLEAAPDGSRAAKATLESGRSFGRVTAGMQIFGGEAFDVRLQYDGLYSSRVQSHGGSLKVSWRY